jgi:hypothetical protein
LTTTRADVFRRFRLVTIFLVNEFI